MEFKGSEWQRPVRGGEFEPLLCLDALSQAEQEVPRAVKVGGRGRGGTNILSSSSRSA